ncbi:MAG: DUF456 domain-containing protein [Fidelibacterota bacterium]
MTLFINIVYWLLLITAIFLIPFNIPGNIIIAGLHLLYMWAFADIINWQLFAQLTILAGIAELIEFIFTVRSTQKYGGSRRSMIGAVIGSVIGAIVGSGVLLLIGTLLGAMVGAYLGSFIVAYIEHQDIEKARRTGLGAFTGVAGGKITKTILGIIMLALIAVN